MSGNILPMYQSDLKGKSSGKGQGSSSNGPSNGSGHIQYVFVVRFVAGHPDIQVPLPAEMSLKDVSTRYIRKQIRTQDPSLATKRLKLIHNGRVLVDHTDFEAEMKFYTPSDEDESGPIKIYIHCMVGDELTPEELAKEEEAERQPEKTTTEAPRGFDRLLSQGFSQQDVNELRREFQDIHGAYGQPGSGVDTRDLEDRWIDSTVNNEIDEFPANLRAAAGAAGAGGAGTGGPGMGGAGNGNGGNGGNGGGLANADGTIGGIGGGFVSREDNVHRELFLGVCVGFFLGVFALFLMILDIGGVFNKRTRMAIVSGVIVNVSFGILKAWS